MSSDDVSFSGTTLQISDLTLAVEYPILDAFKIGGVIIVLYDPRAYYARNPWGQFRNLVALATDGRELWTADLGEGGAYYQVKRQNPLLAYAPSYRYEIDLKTGKILSEEFLK